MPNTLNWWRYIAAVFISLALLPAWASIGVVTHVSGVLVVERPELEPRILAANSPVQEGDVLVSQAKSFARIRLRDGGNLLIRPNSRIKIERYHFDQAKPEADAVSVHLIKGGMRTITGAVARRNPNLHTTITPTATIGIRGTHFGLQMCAGDCVGLFDHAGQPLRDGLHIDVIFGLIAVRNAAGELALGAGQFGFVHTPITLPQVIDPAQGFHAATPPSIAAPAGAGSTVGLNSNDFMCVIR